mmetsp:Transcript_6236/g.10823  ORF Transcript_6236/g.10823 Transcript_6236/m.10823 type:complete len:194 (+) Transcript_6236:537-1118(+)|eukprot:CAMPEP_0204905426 /NCGR_PEP_ID=MMETSP1397-20131031/5411_1 /ASSEMBLY_ACC=CAM_ASM_000891 /TAXON_ID=49980 /ORGANISM="Climacostomum Climacostomum virens, Strain Stock W-24" /LENGTH=193 /DNA_ID=CAMNT_0052074301 /DNA_START=517 /DNA_END=1101 /DNA_ORIENTATION=-
MALLLLLAPAAFAFIIDLQPQASFCFNQDLSDTTFVSIFFLPAGSSKVPISVRAYDNNAQLISERIGDTSPRLAFTTYDGGNFRFCIENSNEASTSVNVLFKVGVEARDYTSLPDTKDLVTVESMIKKITGVVQQVKKELSYVREREEEMRHTNQTIGERVVGYSVLTILMLVGLSVFQIFYLRAFFKAKKVN